MRCLSTLLFATLMPGLVAAADTVPIGRLFSTPAERTQLDRIRSNETIQVEQQADTLTVDGFVRRDGRKSTAWINRQASFEGDASPNVNLARQPDMTPAVLLQLKSGQRLTLKAGQTYDTATGQVTELYQQRPPASNTRPAK